MKLQFDYIVSFVTVVDEGSFSLAAKKLGKSQSTVSTAIQNLEADLGVELFNRQGGKATTTNKGKQFYELSYSLVAKFKDLMTKADHLATADRIVYRVGVDPMVFNQQTKQALLDFSETFHNIDLVIMTKPSFVLGDYLMEGKLDLAIGNPYYKGELDFHIDELFPVNCWWVHHKELVIDQSRDVNRLLLIDGCEQLLNVSKLSSKNLWHLDDLSTITDLCCDKKGIALLPEHYIQTYYRREQLSLLRGHPEFYGKKICASLFWAEHSDFAPYRKWFKNRLKPVTTQLAPEVMI
ncbi:LysR family transcriptional regulator [Vibrio hippocampi]|uniref:HTH lysR-type domain-containing protein n=1 Tax=Vibrio hippocampi TaxID=654686 RepID=A0ABM8ZMD1_9VIBR|nr:LysR family transcriptional regulator [Vibrio hippocampi]CAH0529694.1 hypothetical protein VHP8226_03449 [Vibrio hippocampi]